MIMIMNNVVHMKPIRFDTVTSRSHYYLRSMTSKIAFAILLALGRSMLPAAASAMDQQQQQLPPPRISTTRLRAALSSSDQLSLNLHQLLYNSHGILRISVENNNDDDDGDENTDLFSKLRRRALGHLCDCPTLSSSSSSAAVATTTTTTFAEAVQLYPKDLQQITLPDGTIRRTLASATVGFDMEQRQGGLLHDFHSSAAVALELPSWVGDICGQDAYASFEDLRDAVAEVVELFVSRLDQEREQSNINRGKDQVGGGERYHHSYAQILSDANHLEHFHVYTKSSNNNVRGVGTEGREVELQWSSEDDLTMHGGEESSTATTLDYHTDAGFFLSFVPAMDCRSRRADNTSFFLKGMQKPLSFEEDEVVIMMGAGAQYWLPLPFQGEAENGFLAASHALRLSHGTHRAWYGKMHLLPTSFTSSNSHKAVPSLKHDPSSFRLEHYDAHVPSSPVDGCGTSAIIDLTPGRTVDQNKSQQQQQQQPRRRRLQHVNSPSQCNNQTNFFCWYQCIDIPSSDLAEQYINDGYSLYCLNPALLSSSNNPILDATEPCEGGFVHNSHCIGSWQKTDASVPGYQLPYEAAKQDSNLASTTTTTTTEMEMGGEDPYCYGGTSMYMDGFTWQDTTCVIYLFSSWVLSTRGKFALAALGSILLGILLEFVLWKRRGVYALPPGHRRLLLSTTIYGLQLAMGYLIMLVIMTYSGPLFISTVGGMMLGHMLFNAQDSLARQWREKYNQAEMMNGRDTTYRTDMNGDSSLEANSLFVRRGTNSNTELMNSYQHGRGGGEVEDIASPPVVLEREKFPPTENTNLRSDVADGATPCCQYTL